MKSEETERRWWLRAVYTLAAVGVLAVIVLTYVVATPEESDVFPDRYASAAPTPRELPGVLTTQLGAPSVRGVQIEMLNNGVEIFPAMLDAIRYADSFVNFLTYVYWDGDIAERFADALADASRRGVRVRILLDAVGSARMTDRLVERMQEAGCEVAFFHPVHWYTLNRANNRTHRKILVADSVGFLGGVGIADQWSGNARGPEEWRDVHFRVTGPIVPYLQMAFAANWRQATGQVLVADPGRPAVPRPEGNTVVPVAGRPGGLSSMWFLYWSALRSARREVLIATPYFVPGPELAEEIAATARRGVEITLLVPGSQTDNAVTRYAGQAAYEGLLEAGVRIFEYRPTMMHSKLVVVDDIYSIIGSANFDNRSFDLNDEFSLGVVDSALAQRIERSYRHDLSRSSEITYERWRGRSWLARLRDRAAHLLREQL
jgi:cardiolipin synthase